MKWVKSIALGLAVLLLILAAALWWLLGTNSGLRFALTRAQTATDGALQVQHARGRLIGPLDLAGVRYDDGNGTVVNVATARADLRFWPLLAGRIHANKLDLDGVDVALPRASTDDTASTGEFSLQPPFDLVLDRAHIGTLKVTQDGRPVFASNRLDLAGRWTGREIELRQLVLQAADGHASLDGNLAFGTTYQGNGKLAFAWTAGDTDYAGRLDVQGDGKRARLDLRLTAPAVITLHLELTQGETYAWTGRLDAPRFDPTPLLGESAIKSLAVAMQGHGDRYSGTIQGSLDVNDYRLLLEPLRAKFSGDYATLSLQQLKLGSPQVKGSVQASGSVQLTEKPMSAVLDVRWDELLLPAALAGQELASHGQLSAKGTLEGYQARGQIDLGPPGKLAKLTFAVDGTPQVIKLHTLDLKQKQGGLQANGTLSLQPTLTWQAQATATRFDPGQLFAGWDGAVNFELASRGSLPSNGPDATLEIRQLVGELREHTLSGSGKLHLAPTRVLDGQLELRSSDSRVSLTGKPGRSNDIDLQLAIASLGDWLPEANGRLEGQFRIRGQVPQLSVNGQLRGQSLTWRQQRADTLHLIVGIPDISRPAGKLELQTRDVHLQGLLFQHFNALAEGSQRNHQLRMSVRGSQLSGALALSGSLQGSRWNGTLSTLDLEPQGMPAWHLQQPSPLSYNQGAINVPELCLSAGEPRLCVAATQGKSGTLDANYRLQALPLALLLNGIGGADLPVRADGTLDGNGQFRRTSAGALSGTATLSSAQGSIRHIDHGDEPLLRYRQLSATADLSPARQHIDVRGELGRDGLLDGQITISGPQQILAGRLDVNTDDLAFIELFSSELVGAKGQFDGGFRFTGSLDRPVVTGQANVRDFAVEIPSAGLKLSKGQLSISTADAAQFLVRGSVQSGAGTLGIDGTAGIGPDARTRLTLKGAQFTAADIPAARLVVSPDLIVTSDAKSMDIGGALRIDRAEVNADKLPGAGAIQASPDVVVLDREPPPGAARKLPVTARVKVDLGNKTHVVGMGLDGMVSGVLTVIERPGRPTVGQGQLAVDGTYRAYGQKLDIQRGQLLFASTPIDNPGLNIRAIRKLNPNATIDEGQQVGLLVSGTAQRPVLTVFSNPIMEQSDALSYLVTGKPLSQVRGGEGDAVGAAAQALGSAAGNLLAKSVGSRLGVDDIGVTSSAALGGNSAFTVGKFLSPRLYLSYGVGLFEPGEVVTLRYMLSKRWNFEAQQATDFSRASFNYRIEK
ncbi:MAG TPA: translocation/assembly module TamB domain-containing protein [Rhodanobacter sp.]